MEFKAPGEYVGEWIVGKVQSGLENYVIDFITVSPILLGVSVGVYGLFNMFSSKLAKFSVFLVLLYGFLVIVV